MQRFEGVFPYLVSPIGPSGDILTEVLERLVSDLIDAGVILAGRHATRRAGGRRHDRGLARSALAPLPYVNMSEKLSGRALAARLTGM